MMMLTGGVVRIVTHPRVFASSTPVELALQYAAALRSHPNAVLLAPREKHWEIYSHPYRTPAVRGNPAPEAYLAALAIEDGSSRTRPTGTPGSGSCVGATR